MQEIPIMFCFDKNYVIPASVAFYSLLEHNTPSPEENHYFKLFVIHNDISPQDQEKLKLTITPFAHFASLEFIDAKGLLKEEWDQLKYKHRFTMEMLYKFAAPLFFEKFDKIIISDVDVVFLGDIVKSFIEFDTQERFYVAGVVSNNPEDFLKPPLAPYLRPYKQFNFSEIEAIRYGISAGYLIVNLKQWRVHNLYHKSLQCLKKNINKLTLAEQDIISLVCYPHIKKLSPAHIVIHTSWEALGENWEGLKPNVYTQDEIDEARLHPIQLHYAGAKKPWNFPSQPKSDLWFSHLCKTPFLADYLNQIENIIIQNYKKTLLHRRILRYISKNPLFFISKDFYQALYYKIAKK